VAEQLGELLRQHPVLRLRVIDSVAGCTSTLVLSGR
jgi:hypothetical protein